MFNNEFCYFIVSDTQGHPNSQDKGTKGTGNLTNQPFNRLGWNVEMSGQAKSKQNEVHSQKQSSEN